MNELQFKQTQITLPVLLTNFHRIDIHPLREPPLTFTQFDVISRHLALPHLTILRKRPILQPIASLPLHPIMLISVLVPKLHSDLIICERKQLLAKLIITFLLPFLCEELNNLVGSLDKLVTISPNAIRRIDLCDVFWVSDTLGQMWLVLMRGFAGT